MSVTTGRRIWLLALGAVAVAVAATLFPAAGFGSTPVETGGDWGGNGFAEGPTGVADGPPEPTVVTTRGGEDSSPSPTATPVSTVAETDAPAADPDPPSDSGSEGVSWLPAIALAAGLVAAVAAAVVRARNRAEKRSESVGGGGPGLLTRLAPLERLPGLSPSRLAKRLPQVTLVAVVGLSTSTARVVGAAGRVAGGVASGLRVAVGGGSRSLLRGLGGGLGAVLSPPAVGSLFSVPGLLSGLATGRSTAPTGQSPDADARSNADVEPSEDDESLRTVEDAWDAFVAPLPVADREARTPGELARTAIERGYPDEPVERLTRVFRRVRYGGRQPTDERTRTALEAARRIRDEREGDG